MIHHGMTVDRSIQNHNGGVLSVSRWLDAVLWFGEPDLAL
jgi:hypothetical protein